MFFVVSFMGLSGCNEIKIVNFSAQFYATGLAKGQFSLVQRFLVSDVKKNNCR